MKRLPDYRTGPPDDWRYYVEEYKVMVKATTWTMLMRKVIAVYDANGALPPDNLSFLIEEWLCDDIAKRRGEEYCSDGSKPAQPMIPQGMYAGRIGAGITINDVYKGMKMFTKWLLSGKPLTPIEEASRRARICAQCPHNVDHDQCLQCGKIYHAVKKMIPQDREVEHGRELKVCDICRCHNLSAVSIPLSMMSVPRKEVLPGFCWKLEYYED